LFRVLGEQIAGAEASKKNVAIVVMDLDGFKAANDRFGHLAGNRVLQEVAAGLTACCRVTDFVARLGGDEFVLVLPDVGDAEVAAILERIEHLGPEAGRMACGEPLISISSGVACYPRDGADPETLLERADNLMYQCKKLSKMRRATDRSPLAVLAEARAPVLQLTVR
jgi:diguanylate cyclase (GGDEF)-like protein